MIFLVFCATTQIQGTIQPVTLKITDSETGLPLPNITVFYELQKVRIVWPLETRFITIDRQRFITNSNGKITVQTRRNFLWPHEEFANISFFINIGIRNKRIPSRGGFHNITTFLISDVRNENIVFRNNIILIDDNYFASCVHVFNNKEKNERETNRNNFLWYQIETPFDEEITITARLVRNTESSN
jgi:hypothetical protein